MPELGGANEDASLLPFEEFLEHEDPVYARLNDEFRWLINMSESYV